MEKLSSDVNVVSALVAEATKEEPKHVETAAPTDNEVTLPGGFIAPGGVLVKHAEVKELDGADEEAISRAGSMGKSLSTILQRGVVSIGDEPVGKHALDDMLAADRDALMIGIRRVTFGDTVEYFAACECGVSSTFEIDLVKDVPVKHLENPNQGRQWVVETKMGPVVVALPTGVTQKRLLEASDKTTAELSTVLLAGCVQSIDGKISTGATSVLKLGMSDREKIINTIVENNPGPRLGEVTQTCEACGEAVSTPLSLLALFRL